MACLAYGLYRTSMLVLLASAASAACVLPSFEEATSSGTGGTAGNEPTCVPVMPWSQSFGGLQDDLGRAIAVEPCGNVVIVGNYDSYITFDGENPVQALGMGDIFVAKYDGSGKHLWSRQFGNTSYQSAEKVALDKNGNLLVAGLFKDTLEIVQDSPLMGTAYNGVFLAKLDSAGNPLWSLSLYDSSASGPELAISGLAIDSEGNTLLLGDWAGTVDFGSGPMTNLGSRNIFLSKVDPSGKLVWTNTYYDNETFFSRGLAVDNLNNVLITGYYSSPLLTLGGPNLPDGNESPFVAKYDKDGTHLWSKGFSATNYAGSYGLATDSSNNVFLVGAFASSVDFGGGQVVTMGGHDIYVVKLDALGAYKWSQVFASTGEDYGISLTIKNDDNLVLGGISSSTNLAFGNTTLMSQGDFDIFVAHLSNETGEAMSAVMYGDSLRQDSIAVGVDANNNVAVTGSFVGSIGFDGESMTTVGGQDIFAAMLRSGPQ